jgi:hypothetical protein
MARLHVILGVLRALGRACWREIHSFKSVGGQNFLLFVALQMGSAQFFLLILGAVVFFPLSSDPVEKIPRDRRDLWPINGLQWMTIRIASLVLSPVMWLATILVLRVSWQLSASVVLIGAFAAVVLPFGARFAGDRKISFARWIPAPPGSIGAIMRLQWREMLSTLDPFVAIALTAASLAYQFFDGPLDPAAPRVLASVITLALSTHTQVMLGIDGTGAGRWLLIPMPTWKVLLAKDLAFLALVVILTLPFDVMAGVSTSLVALATGRYRSVASPVPQIAWRFTAGRLAPDGIVQIIAIFAAGNAIGRGRLVALSAGALLWAASLAIAGVWWGKLRKR